MKTEHCTMTLCGMEIETVYFLSPKKNGGGGGAALCEEVHYTNKYGTPGEGPAFQEKTNNSALKIGLYSKVLPLTSHNVTEYSSVNVQAAESVV
jgi:hypothetical protein